jgi:hypothetical protein
MNSDIPSSERISEHLSSLRRIYKETGPDVIFERFAMSFMARRDIPAISFFDGEKEVTLKREDASRLSGGLPIFAHHALVIGREAGMDFKSCAFVFHEDKGSPSGFRLELDDNGDMVLSFFLIAEAISDVAQYCPSNQLSRDVTEIFEGIRIGASSDALVDVTPSRPLSKSHI